jgi:hypothetical protein
MRSTLINQIINKRFKAENGEMIYLNERLLLFPKRLGVDLALEYIINNNILSKEDAGKLNYLATKKGALKYGKNYMINFVPKMFYKNIVLEIHNSSGEGIIEYIPQESNPEKYVFTKKTSILPEQEILKKHNMQTDAVSRGIIAGVLESIEKQPYECIETDCVYKGDKNCKFIAMPKSKFDMTKKETQDQIPDLKFYKKMKV